MSRSACWSITINNPTEEDLDFKRVIANGWRMQGQIEKGNKDGTIHYQGMLVTPQKPAFSTVKRVLPRAHIEVARQKELLAKYVHKDETRVATVETKGIEIPTLFEYQDTVAKELSFERVEEYVKLNHSHHNMISIDDAAMQVIDIIVKKHIEGGMRGIEFIAINPMWLSSWKKFWRSIIKRNACSHGEQVRVESGVLSADKEGAVSQEDAPFGQQTSSHGACSASEEDC